MLVVIRPRPIMKKEKEERQSILAVSSIPDQRTGSVAAGGASDTHAFSFYFFSRKSVQRNSADGPCFFI